MASERFIRRTRLWYAKLLRLYPAAYRERFTDGMEQTFKDLCRERARANKGLFTFFLWMFFETSTSILRENATNILRSFMKQDSTSSLKLVKYGAIGVAILMLTGIVVLMILARGKGEDIAGIVASALFVTIISGIVATVAAVLQKRALKSER